MATKVLLILISVSSWCGFLSNWENKKEQFDICKLVQMWEMTDRHTLTSGDITTNKRKTSRNIKKNPQVDFFFPKLSQSIVGLNTDSNEEACSLWSKSSNNEPSKLKEEVERVLTQKVHGAAVSTVLLWKEGSCFYLKLKRHNRFSE